VVTAVPVAQPLKKHKSSILGEKNGFIRGVLRHLILLNAHFVFKFRGA